MESPGSVTRYAFDMHSPDAARREEAARRIWLRFSARLRGLVRSRLDPRILRRAGEEDVLQSLFASFFAAPAGAGGPPQSRADLWRLLVHFALCKVVKNADYHRAQRRDVRRERSLNDTPDAGFAPTEPEDLRWIGPEDEAAAREEFDRLRNLVPEDLLPVFDLRLEGYTNAEIARRIERVERTVELKLRAIRSVLTPHLDRAVLPPQS
jgi:DNA-directed RNA polymerase specialized sigma24 family protein